MILKNNYKRLLFACVLLTFIFTSSICPRRNKNQFHRVRPGEYLGLIAKKYGTKISKLRKLNHLSKNSVLPAGKLIKVGTRYRTTSKKKRHRAVRYKVRYGDTLSHLAVKFNTRTSLIRKWNHIPKKAYLVTGKSIIVSKKRSQRSKKRKFKRKKAKEITSWKQISAYTKVKLPLNYRPAKVRKRSFKTKHYTFRVFSAGFKQGRAAYLELITSKKKKTQASSFHIKFLNKKIPLTKTSYGFRSVFALPPEQKPGRYAFSIDYDANQKSIRNKHYIYIADIKFPVSIWRKNVGRPSRRRPMKQATVDFLKSNRSIKARAFKILSSDKFTSWLSHPRSLHKITSKFYTTRKMVRYYYKNRKRVYLKARHKMHRGTDLRGLTGAPLYSMAAGRVVIADRMFYEGNFTMIDHGHGIFTGYMHQSKMNVYKGKKVLAGELIGKSGGTGAVTGPHLHMSLWIRGDAVDPLSLLSLPIRK